MSNIQEKIEQNIWDDIQRDFLPILMKALLPHGDPNRWSWVRSASCKYVDLRIDMRDGGCIIRANGKRISPEQLAWQYSKETEIPPDEGISAKENVPSPEEVLAALDRLDFNESDTDMYVRLPRFGNVSVKEALREAIRQRNVLK